MKTVAMQCASCGAVLQITPDMDHFVCSYCGASLSVVRQGGTVTLRLVTDSIAKVQVGTDRTAAELALVRLPKEIAERQRELDAMTEQICSLEVEISKASLPKTGSRTTSIYVDHFFHAIGLGIAYGLFIGLIVNWFFQAWLPSYVGVWAGLIFGVAHAIKYFTDPLQVSDRLSAWSYDYSDKTRRQNASFNANELLNLQQARSALEDRLQKLNRQVTAAHAIVN